MIHTCEDPPRLEMKAMCLESGAHCGRSLSVPAVVICFGVPPVVWDGVYLFRLGVLIEVDGLNGGMRRFGRPVKAAAR